MLLIFPKKYEYETRLAPKRLMRRLEGDLLEYRPTMNVLSTSRFMKAHKLESVYYGRHDSDSFELYYHRIKKRDGGSTGFYGKVIRTEKGSLIKGSFRKPVYAYVFAIVWVALCLVCAVGTYAAESAVGAYIFLGVGLAGFLLMLCDNHEQYLRAYIEGLPPAEEEKEE